MAQDLFCLQEPLLSVIQGNYDHDHGPLGRDMASLFNALCLPMRQPDSLSKLSTAKLRARLYVHDYEM